MIKKNAIILAAGKSNRFAPFTYEKPKGLFRVKGEILVERQIEQLREAGVEDICIVVGYMKEKFFYLEDKYGGEAYNQQHICIKGQYRIALCCKRVSGQHIYMLCRSLLSGKSIYG